MAFADGLFDRIDYKEEEDEHIPIAEEVVEEVVEDIVEEIIEETTPEEKPVSTWEQEYMNGIYIAIGIVVLVGLIALAVWLYQRYHNEGMA